MLLLGYARFVDICTSKDEHQLSGNDALCEYEQQKLTKRLILLGYARSAHI